VPSGKVVGLEVPYSFGFYNIFPPRAITMGCYNVFAKPFQPSTQMTDGIWNFDRSMRYFGSLQFFNTLIGSMVASQFVIYFITGELIHNIYLIFFIISKIFYYSNILFQMVHNYCNCKLYNNFIIKFCTTSMQ